MNYKFLLIAVLGLFLFYSHLSSAQSNQAATDSSNNKVKDELEFVSYLLGKQDYKSTLLASEPLFSTQLTPVQRHELNYMNGWAAYHLKQLKKSNTFFAEVPSSSKWYTKSTFFRGFNNAYLGELNAAQETFNLIAIENDSAMLALRNFEMAGTALLQRDYALFDSLSAQFQGSFYATKEEESGMLYHRDNLMDVKKKSPFVAGLLSAVIPGSGKYYAGYRGQALAAALPPLAFGAVALESYLKAGPASPQFIVFASLFSVFYV